jgi:hypothetical protein
MAGRHLGRSRLLVQAPLPTLLVLEMLHRVRDVHVRGVDPGFGQARRQDPAGRTHERVTLAVLLIAGLLADQTERGGSRPLPEHRLGGVVKERTPGAAGRRLLELGERIGVRYERSGRPTFHGRGVPVAAMPHTRAASMR